MRFAFHSRTDAGPGLEELLASPDMLRACLLPLLPTPDQPGPAARAELGLGSTAAWGAASAGSDCLARALLRIPKLQMPVLTLLIQQVRCRSHLR